MALYKIQKSKIRNFSSGETRNDKTLYHFAIKNDFVFYDDVRAGQIYIDDRKLKRIVIAKLITME